MASTTPWQYPRGVMRTTSIRSPVYAAVSARRSAARGELEAGRSGAPGASAEQKPGVEEHPAPGTDRVLGGGGEVARRDESLEQPGDDEQRGDAHTEDDGAERDRDQRVAAAEQPGAEDGVAEHQPGGAGEHDDAELDDPVGDDVRPEAVVDAVAVDRRGEGAEHPAVGEQGQRRRDAEQDAAAEAEQRHLDVVADDQRGRDRGVADAAAHLA